jgi:hypothetical protein
VAGTTVSGTAAGGDNREQGSAVVEFVSLGVLLMVPLVYLVLAMARVQAASFAADGSARAAARAYVTAPDEREAERRSTLAVGLGLRDQGFEAADGSVTIDCGRARCLTPGARIVARVTVDVVLPGIPRGLGHSLSTEVTVRASQVVSVDEFRSVGR